MSQLASLGQPSPNRRNKFLIPTSSASCLHVHTTTRDIRFRSDRTRRRRNSLPHAPGQGFCAQSTAHVHAPRKGKRNRYSPTPSVYCELPCPLSSSYSYSMYYASALPYSSPISLTHPCPFYGQHPNLPKAHRGRGSV